MGGGGCDGCAANRRAGREERGKWAGWWRLGAPGRVRAAAKVGAVEGVGLTKLGVAANGGCGLTARGRRGGGRRVRRVPHGGEGAAAGGWARYGERKRERRRAADAVGFPSDGGY